MNLEKLFAKQRELDERIVKEKGLEGQDLLPKKILALQVELGELANEWRGFKFWSENQKPRKIIHTTVGANLENADYLSCGECSHSISSSEKDFEKYVTEDLDCPECECCMYLFRPKNVLLEEYVDCLHFFLSIGIDVNTPLHEIEKTNLEGSTEDIFNLAFEGVANIRFEKAKKLHHMSTFMVFLQLGERLGFTWEQIEQAYHEKHAVNVQRQQEGY